MGYYDIGYQAFYIVFFIFVVIFIGAFAAALIRGIGTWSKNNQSPKLTVDAEMVTKR